MLRKVIVGNLGNFGPSAYIALSSQETEKLKIFSLSLSLSRYVLSNRKACISLQVIVIRAQLK